MRDLDIFWHTKDYERGVTAFAHRNPAGRPGLPTKFELWRWGVIVGGTVRGIRLGLNAAVKRT